MSDFKTIDLPQIDIDALDKGRCPWCYRKLTPVFKDDEHIADECEFCGDTFE